MAVVVTTEISKKFLILLDGARTVHTDIPELNVLMKKAAEGLGVKGHIVGFNQKSLLYGPADIEAHLGKDGRYYVLDTARYYFF
jgi:hypothetical protein